MSKYICKCGNKMSNFDFKFSSQCESCFEKAYEDWMFDEDNWVARDIGDIYE